MRNPKIPLFFDGQTGDYWLQVGQRFMKLNQRDLEMHLTVRGIDDFKHFSNQVLEKEKAVRFWAQTERRVDYAGPLAGHKPGAFMTADGKRILVTSGAEMPEPVKGRPDAFEDFIAELLPDGQATHFLHWLKVRAESLEAVDFRASQLFVMAGPSGCGKSLCQDLVTEFFGGRVAKPIRYMTDATPFNSDLAGAEHWLMSDEKGLSGDIRSRRNFGEAIKEMCVVREMSVHAKGKEAITLPTWRTGTLTLNDEQENVCKLPPLDDSIIDKIFLTKCAKAKIGSNRIKVWKKLKSDLPALRWQLQQMQIPKDRQCPRYGVKSWHHPELLEVLQNLSPEQRLLALIDEVIELDHGCWLGTAMKLEQELRNGGQFNFAADKLFTWSGSCAQLLARLKAQYPARFEQVRTETTREWRITR